MDDTERVDKITVTGLENGQKRVFEWVEGELMGDDDLKARFQEKWDAADQKKFRNSLPPNVRKEWPRRLALKLLPALFSETLDFHDHLSYEKHNTPPYRWEEIEECLAGQEIPVGETPAISIMGTFDDDTPEDTPKCLECLQPMEWIWFKSHPWTWKNLCGRAGWTAICRKCKSWRACRVTMMN